MRTWAKWLIAVLIVLIVGGTAGVLTAIWEVDALWGMGRVKSGPWGTNFTYGGKDANPWVRAGVAARGLLALTKTETVYFSPTTDSQGRTLSTDCDYTIEGKGVDARWWSITVYGDDNFLIPNTQKRYGYTMNNLHYEDDGSFKIRLSRLPAEGNWLPLGERTQDFSLTLRLYNPGEDVYVNTGKLDLPQINREACQ
jgi:hypothetical protein